MTLHLDDEAAYRAHYIATFTRSPLTFNTATMAARVYFDASQFDHAFFESTNRDKIKDKFSTARAERMDELADLLADITTERRAGWDRSKRSYDHVRCVSVSRGDFVVVVRLGLTGNAELKARFVTCYVADNSIDKIRKSPEWDESECLRTLAGQRNGR